MVPTASGRRAAGAPGAPRSRLAAGGVAGLVALALGLVLAVLVRDAGERGGSPPAGEARDRLRVPPRGEAVAEVLDDGTPVFVVHARAGDVYVVVAGLGAAGAGPRSIDEATVGWCPRARTFEDPAAGHLFDARGRPLGGHPPGGLPQLPVERLDERTIAVGPGPAVPADARRPGQPTGRPCLDEPHLLVVHDELVVRASG